VLTDRGSGAAPVGSGGSRPAVAGGWRRLLRTPTPVIFAASVAVALLLLWRQGSLADLGAALAGADGGAIAAGFALYAAGLLLLCARWHLLVRMVGGAADFPVAAEAFLTSVVVNYAAPIGLAVPARALLSSRDLRLPAVAGGAVAFWEVALDLLLLGLVGAAWLVADGGAVAAGWGPAPPVWLAAVALAVLAGIGFVAVVLLRRRPALGRRVAAAAGDALRYPGRRPKAAAAAVALTLLFWLLQAVILRLLLAAVGLAAVSWGAVAGLMALPILLGMVSPVPGGAGVREALMVAVAHARGLDGAAVLLAAVAYRVALFGAIPVVYAGVRSWRALRRGGRRDAGGSGGSG